MKIKTVKKCLDCCSDIQELIAVLPAECSIVRTVIMSTLEVLRAELVHEIFSKQKYYVK